eukprot:771526-Pleurochrysis_carterae.AAC.1
MVEAAVAAAMGRDGGSDEQPTAANGVLAAAGRACLAALHGTLDALGTGGAAEVAREARAFRDETGMLASAGARGAFAATVLRVAAAREMAAAATASPLRQGAPPTLRRSPRRSPQRSSQPTTL